MKTDTIFIALMTYKSAREKSLKFNTNMFWCALLALKDCVDSSGRFLRRFMQKTTSNSHPSAHTSCKEKIEVELK